MPGAVKDIPVIYMTNIFGKKPDDAHIAKIDKILFVSSWLKNVAAPWSNGNPRAFVLYCPVEAPQTGANLRSELGIGDGVFVVGRIGRNADDIHDPVSLKAYKEIENGRTVFFGLVRASSNEKGRFGSGNKKYNIYRTHGGRCVSG